MIPARCFSSLIKMGSNLTGMITGAGSRSLVRAPEIPTHKIPGILAHFDALSFELPPCIPSNGDHPNASCRREIPDCPIQPSVLNSRSRSRQVWPRLGLFFLETDCACQGSLIAESMSGRNPCFQTRGLCVRSPTRATDFLADRCQKLLHEGAALGALLRGSLMGSYRERGKPNCRCTGPDLLAGRVAADSARSKEWALLWSCWPRRSNAAGPHQSRPAAGQLRSLHGGSSEKRHPEVDLHFPRHAWKRERVRSRAEPRGCSRNRQGAEPPAPARACRMPPSARPVPSRDC